MKHWNRCLLPILTAMIALATALLPPHLSQMRDRALSESVHSEDMAAGPLPSSSLSIEEKISLLSRWYGDAESVCGSYMAIGAEGLEYEEAWLAWWRDAASAVREEAARLIADLAGDPAVWAELGAEWDFSALSLQSADPLCLRDPETLAESAFLICTAYGGNLEIPRIVLDGETGLALDFSLWLQNLPKKLTPLGLDDPERAGAVLLGRLGLPENAYEIMEPGDRTAAFRLKESGVLYLTGQYNGSLWLNLLPAESDMGMNVSGAS